jgi:hypothetical protein
MAKGSSDQAKEGEKTGRRILKKDGKAIESKLSDANKAIKTTLKKATKGAKKIIKGK